MHQGDLSWMLKESKDKLLFLKDSVTHCASCSLECNASYFT